VTSVVVFGDGAIPSGLIQPSSKDELGTAQHATFRFLAMLQKQQKANGRSPRYPPDLEKVNDSPAEKHQYSRCPATSCV
jgi:hypothetical protein